MKDLSARQVAWFRLRRSGLVEPFASAPACAAALIGVQAQLVPAAGLAIANRTRGFRVASLDRAIMDKRTLVRFWGQRNTLHLYSTEDWPRLHPAFATLRALMDRRLDKAGLLEDFQRLVRRVEQRLARGEQLSHADIRAPELEQQDKWVVSYLVFMNLVRRGVVCYGPGAGKETRFVHRRHWLPDLEWRPPPADRATAALARRYLSTYGPARVQDFAFWFGISAAQARRWLGRAGAELIEVTVAGASHWCVAEDLPVLAEAPPVRSRWPVKMLNRYDPLLLAHKNKSWLIDEPHYKKVWLPSAHVAPVVLVGGRIAGTWRYQRSASRIDITAEPFSPLAKTVVKRIESEARKVARFFGRPLGGVEIGD